MPAVTMAPRGQNARNPPRGPAASRRGGVRKGGDRDGDVSMDTAVKGRGRIGKSTPPPNSRDSNSRGGRGGRAGILSDKARSAIIRQAASSDVSMKEPRTAAPRGGLVELKVTGWEKSKASSDADGGVSSLIKWMEKKASHRLGSRTREVKIKKSRKEDSNTLYISVPAEDVPALVRMNGYGWAGTTVTIQRADGTTTDPKDKATEDTKAMLKRVLEGRYNMDTKFLDLSALNQDQELNNYNIFAQSSTAHKAVRAMMKVLEGSFDSEAERSAAVTSVSLANNGFVDLADVKDLSYTLPKLINLDLSNNNLAQLSSLEVWKRRFNNLQHLIVSGNPLEQNEPNYAAELIKWYPNLRMLNNIQVRTEEEIANKLKGKLPFPIKSPLFQDQEGICENFVRTFFAGFDNDRAGVAAHYYDDTSDFSFAVNTQAPRDPAASTQTEKQEWEEYIKNSRNLKKISHLPARQNRLFRGTKAVSNIFASLPKTRHPDLASEAKKWMIEAHIQSGVPDPTGQAPNGVDGFMITIHGEFDELDNNGQAKKKRSFDRTFIIGPGGPSGVRVVVDMMTIRAYGGAQAFDPENFEGWNDRKPNDLNLPEGLSVEVAQQMLAELGKQTGMNVDYSKQCLEQVGWNFDEALKAFSNVKANLPAEAFAQPAQ